MTDKEIIIDGVDVSECRHSQTFSVNVKCECEYEEFNGEIETFDECKTLPNCYFKQLKRKEQECEELYKQVKILTMQLENFNEKLLRNKAIIEFADCPYYSYGDNTIEPTCTKNFCYDVKSCDHKNMVKYKQALDEIEKFCDKILADILHYSQGTINTAEKIRNIINKAKDNIND